MPKLYITVGQTQMSATLVNNSSTQALVKKLRQGDVTIDMHDAHGFEFVGELGFDLPTNDEDISTEACDLILYLGHRFVIYYDHNQWNFTRLGKIDNLTQKQLKNILGTGNIKVMLSLQSSTTGIKGVSAESTSDVVYDVQGHRLAQAAKGLVISKGRKYFKK